MDIRTINVKWTTAKVSERKKNLIFVQKIYRQNLRSIKQQRRKKIFQNNIRIAN